MDKNLNQIEQLEKEFDREIKELLSTFAEICVHDFLNQTNKETEDVERETNSKTNQ